MSIYVGFSLAVALRLKKRDKYRTFHSESNRKIFNDNIRSFDSLSLAQDDTCERSLDCAQDDTCERSFDCAQDDSVNSYNCLSASLEVRVMIALMGKLWYYLDPSAMLRMTRYCAQDDKIVCHSERSDSVIEESL